MAMLLIEGFELHDTDFISYEKLQDFLGTTQGETATWPTGPTMVATGADSRISGGRSLQVTRADDTGDNGDIAIRVGFDFSIKDHVACGFGIKFDQEASNPVPLVQFNFAAEFGNEEQLSLWAATDGGLFASSDAISIDNSVQPGPTVIAESIAAIKAFRFTEWVYVEVSLDLSVATPTLHVAINGVTVVDSVAAADFMKASIEKITNVSFIFPGSNLFNGTGLVTNLDDVYITWADTGETDILLGPQEIIGVPYGTVLENDLDAGGEPPEIFDQTGSVAIDSGKSSPHNFKVEADNLDPGIVSVSALSVSSYVQDAVGLANVVVGAYETTDTDGFTFQSTVGGSAGPALVRAVSDEAPGAMTLSGPGLDDLKYFVRILEVV